ncbi:helix-turn-helix transcriptional regulator [Corallococcus silvisoli]|uniref:helix-turn-helix transcriptional regulator n=1 Tax=Corallococcus silvisoli TaxID=2697031 RepID=UPI001F433E79|nr:helix-turn-helix transcriptional regulator [Corallococcus silvisoli]
MSPPLRRGGYGVLTQTPRWGSVFSLNDVWPEDRLMPRAVVVGELQVLELQKESADQRETGLTPHQFLLRTRVLHALALLRDTRRPVTEIAFDVGFGDLSNFIHTFRRELGCSPRAFREATPAAWAAASLQTQGAQ